MDIQPIQPQKHPQTSSHTPSFSDSHPDEPDVCRVCRVEGDEEDPLIFPCKCSGSVRYVHPDCLKSWLAHSQKRYCEICGHKYTFTKVYPEYIPDVIPPVVYVRQALRWLVSSTKLFLRFCLAVCVWLIALPSMNMGFLRSLLWLADAIVRPSPGVSTAQPEHPSGTGQGAQVIGVPSWKSIVTAQSNSVVGYVFRGQILSLTMAGVILCLVLVREWIHRHDWTEHLQPALNEQEVIQPDDWVIQRGVAIKRSDLLAEGPIPPVNDASNAGVDESTHHLRAFGPSPMDVAFTPPELLGRKSLEEEASEDPVEQIQEDDNVAFMELLRSLDVDGPQPNGTPARPQFLEPEPIRPPQEIADHPIWDDAEDGNWEREDWDGILEVVGLIGPISNLFQNAILALIIIGATLTVLVGTPMITGKVALSLDIFRSGYLILRVFYRLARKVTDPVVDVCFEIAREAIALPLLSSVKALERIMRHHLHMAEEAQGAEKTVQVTAPRLITDVVDKLAQFHRDRRDWAIKTATSEGVVDRVWCLMVGYFIGGLIIAGVALAGEASTSRLSSTVRETMRQYGKFLKLAFFMALEMAIFPIVAGTAINISLIPLFEETTLSTRIRQFCSSPFAMIFVNWLLGTSFMYAFSALLSHIRTIVRPGTIYFIRDPTDASFSPVKDILERGTVSQLRKLLASAMMYCIIIFSLFGAVTWTLACQSLLPVVPLRLKNQSPWSSVPFDLLIVHLIVPPTIRAVRPRNKARKALNSYWRTASSCFGLSSLMYGNARRAAVERQRGGARVLELIWPFLDPLFQLAFGRYDKNQTDARVPATDRVALLPQAERREHGVFIPLDENGSPRYERGKLALLKQDRRAREKGRVPKDDYQIIWLPRFWRTRIHVFILAVLAVSSWSLAIAFYGPLLVGRAASGLMGAPQCHDGYNYMLGVYVCLLATRLGRFAERRISRSAYAKRLRRSDPSVRFKRSVLTGVSTCCTLIMTYAVVPLLIGLNLELYLSVPIRYGLQMAVPVIHAWDAWANGTMLVTLLVGIMRDQPIRGGRQGSGRSSLRVLLQIYKTPTQTNFRQLIGAVAPTIITLVLSLCLPIVVVLFLLWASSQTLRAAIIFRIVYPASLCFFGSLLLGMTLRPRIESIRQKMVDAEFVVEERVENYNPDVNEQESHPEVKGDDADGDDWVDEDD